MKQQMEKCPGTGAYARDIAGNPRASCPVCGKHSALTRGGTIFSHVRVKPKPAKVTPEWTHEDLMRALQTTEGALRRSGTPSNAILWLLKDQVAGWVKHDVTTLEMAISAWTEFMLTTADRPYFVELDI